MKTLLVWLLVCFSASASALASGEDPSTSGGADEAFRRLAEGNGRFVEGRPSGQGRDEARRLAVAGGQHPFATVLSCSDSRVPVEILFDQGIGDVFVVRVAGNVADTDEIGTIEYGAGHLHTPLLVVLGHTACGAVKAVAEGAQVHGSLPELVDNIQPAVREARARHGSTPRFLTEAIRANVWLSIEDLFRRSEEVRTLVREGKLEVVGALYSLETGAVAWMGEHPEKTRLLKPVQTEPPADHGHAPAAPPHGAAPAVKH
jgi:carbonic anhydrase